MEHEIKGIAITWLIENDAKYIHQLNSPVITLGEVEGTKWKLSFIRKTDSIFTLNIKRELEDDGPKEIRLNYEFTVESLNAAYLNVIKIDTFTFQKDQMCPEIEMNHESITTSAFPDSIIIRCNIYKQQGSISTSSHIFVRSRVRTECQLFEGAVQNFKDIAKYEKRTLKTVLSQSGEKLMAVDFVYSVFTIFPDIEDMQILCFSYGNKEPKRFFNLKFFILDSSGRKTNIKREEEFILESSLRFNLPKISRQIIMKNATRILKSGDLYLHFEITYFSGIEHQKVERSQYENDPKADLKPTDFSSTLAILTSKNGIPYDTKLQTASETFPAHTAILSAHSLIFDVMFKANMKETIQKCVQIDDLDAETVKNMLLFMYSDSLEVPDWKGALNLYLAADKYQILNLKNKCAFILRQRICLSNCCVLLLIADIFQDEDLKRAVHDYLTPNGKYVIYSDQWRILEKDHPQLVLEYFHELFRRGSL